MAQPHSATPTSSHVPNPKTNTYDVFDSDYQHVYSIPAQAVSQLPGDHLCITRLVICRNYVPGDASSCTMGAECKFVHVEGDLSSLPKQQIHVNYAWRSPDLSIYRRLPTGMRLTVGHPQPNSGAAPLPSEELLSENVLVTKGSLNAFNKMKDALAKSSGDKNKVQQPTMTHCAHFYYKNMCNRGEQCNFIHTVHIDPTARDFQRAPQVRMPGTVEGSYPGTPMIDNHSLPSFGSPHDGSPTGEVPPMVQLMGDGEQHPPSIQHQMPNNMAHSMGSNYSGSHHNLMLSGSNNNLAAQQAPPPHYSSAAASNSSTHLTHNTRRSQMDDPFGAAASASGNNVPSHMHQQRHTFAPPPHNTAPPAHQHHQFSRGPGSSLTSPNASTNRPNMGGSQTRHNLGAMANPPPPGYHHPGSRNSSMHSNFSQSGNHHPDQLLASGGFAGSTSSNNYFAPKQQNVFMQPPPGGPGAPGVPGHPGQQHAFFASAAKQPSPNSSNLTSPKSKTPKSQIVPHTLLDPTTQPGMRAPATDETPTYQQATAKLNGAFPSSSPVEQVAHNGAYTYNPYGASISGNGSPTGGQ